MNDERTLAMLAEEADFVQSACNLSGVVHGFSRAISRLRQLHPNEGTEFFNTHPICVLWADKIKDLTRANDERVIQAYLEVRKLYEEIKKERLATK